MRNTVIFDLDGTLALIEHRRYLVEPPAGSTRMSNRWYKSTGEKWTPNWNKFFDECVNDEPNTPIIIAAQALRDRGCEIVIYSGRSDRVRPQTEEWLNIHLVPYKRIRMRPEGTYTEDELLKRSWLFEDFGKTHVEKILCVYDDRDKVVKMRRELGLICCQVAPGNF